jgi:hypothetical protein
MCFFTLILKKGRKEMEDKEKYLIWEPQNERYQEFKI